MAKTAGGIRGAVKKNTEQPKVDVQTVKNSLVSYSKEDRWNNNTAYRLGFNERAQSVVDEVARGNYGFASKIAQTVQKYNYKISEKQAYHIANAAVSNNLSSLYNKNGDLDVLFKKTEVVKNKKKRGGAYIPRF